jgi:hypothetical protein
MTETIQERWDSTFAKLDRACPVRIASETSADYLRRLSRIGKRYLPRSEEVYSVPFNSELPDAVVEAFSEMVRSAVERNLLRTDNMKPGELRQVLIQDENTGAKQRHWIGPTSFVREMGTPCRKVLRINTPPSTPLYSANRRELGVY